MVDEQQYPSTGEVLEVPQPEKEPLRQSGRVQIFLTTIISELLLIPANWLSTRYGVDIPPDLLQAIATGIAIVGGALIAGRSYRNTPAK